jgi:hypothetical protein
VITSHWVSPLAGCVTASAWTCCLGPILRAGSIVCVVTSTVTGLPVCTEAPWRIA